MEVSKRGKIMPTPAAQETLGWEGRLPTDCWPPWGSIPTSCIDGPHTDQRKQHAFQSTLVWKEVDPLQKLLWKKARLSDPKSVCYSLSHVRLSATPWTVACQARLSMKFSRQEYWSGLPFPSPGDLPNPGIKPRSPALQADALTPELLVKPRVELKCLEVVVLFCNLIVTIVVACACSVVSDSL